MQFRDFRSSTDDQLPSFNLDEYAAIDHFWSAMAKVEIVTDLETLRFGTLARLAIILPLSNVDPERLFSMVRKISTEQRRQLDPSTVRDLLSVKINNDSNCYDNKSLMTDSLLSSARSATQRMQKD